MNVDPLVRGIYYMFLVDHKPSHTIMDKEVTECIKDIMIIHQVPLYGSIGIVKHILIKELLRRYVN